MLGKHLGRPLKIHADGHEEKEQTAKIDKTKRTWCSSWCQLVTTSSIPRGRTGKDN